MSQEFHDHFLAFCQDNNIDPKSYAYFIPDFFGGDNFTNGIPLEEGINDLLEVAMLQPAIIYGRHTYTWNGDPYPEVIFGYSLHDNNCHVVLYSNRIEFEAEIYGHPHTTVSKSKPKSESKSLSINACILSWLNQ